MAAEPAVTIGMPVRNGARYLEGAVRSLLSQSNEDFRLVISDNASTDDTPQLGAALAAEDSRIDYIRRPKTLTATESADIVLQEASSPLFMWAAHDDLWEPDFLTETLARLDAQPDAVGCAVGGTSMDEYGRPIGRFTPTALLGDPDVRVRSEAILRSRPFAVYGLFRRPLLATQNLEYTWRSDRILLFRLALRWPFAVSSRSLFRYRVVDDFQEKGNSMDAHLYTGSAQQIAHYRRAWNAVGEAGLSRQDEWSLRLSVVKYFAFEGRGAALETSVFRFRQATSERRYGRAGSVGLTHVLLRPSSLVNTVAWRKLAKSLRRLDQR